MKQGIKVLFFSAVLALAGAKNADAYSYTFSNETGKKVSLDFCGAAVIGSSCSLMQHRISATGGFLELGSKYRINGQYLPNEARNIKEFPIERFGEEVDVSGAGSMHGPIFIQPGQTVTLRFNDPGDQGYCIDLKNIKIGIPEDKLPNITRQVFKLDDQTATHVQAIADTVQASGTTAGTAGESSGNPKAQAAGKAAEAGLKSIGDIIKAVAPFFQNMFCKNATFVIYEGMETLPTGKEVRSVYLTTRD